MVKTFGSEPNKSNRKCISENATIDKLYLNVINAAKKALKIAKITGAYAVEKRIKDWFDDSEAIDRESIEELYKIAVHFNILYLIDATWEAAEYLDGKLKYINESTKPKGLSDYQKEIIYDMADEDYEAGHPFTPEDALDWFESGEEESIPPELAKDAADYYFEAFDDIRENDNNQYDESVKSHNKPIKERYSTMRYSDIPEYPFDTYDDPSVFCGHLNHYLPNKFHINCGGALFTLGTGSFFVYVSNEDEMFRGSVIYMPDDNKIYFTINSEDAELGTITIDEDTTWDDLGDQVTKMIS